MDRVDSFKDIFFLALKKSFILDQGGVALFAFLSSLPTNVIINLIFENKNIDEIYVSIIIFCILSGMYFVVWFFDFFTGLAASRYKYRQEHGHTRGYFENEKAWSAIWKFSGMVIVTITFLLIHIIFTFLDYTLLKTISLFLMIFFFILPIFTDIIGIGENHRKRFKKAPYYLQFMKSITITLKNSVINKIKNFGNEKE